MPVRGCDTDRNAAAEAHAQDAGSEGEIHPADRALKGWLKKRDLLREAK